MQSGPTAIFDEVEKSVTTPDIRATIKLGREIERTDRAAGLGFPNSQVGTAMHWKGHVYVAGAPDSNFTAGNTWNIYKITEGGSHVASQGIGRSVGHVSLVEDHDTLWAFWSQTSAPNLGIYRVGTTDGLNWVGPTLFNFHTCDFIPAYLAANGEYRYYVGFVGLSQQSPLLSVDDYLYHRDGVNYSANQLGVNKPMYLYDDLTLYPQQYATRAYHLGNYDYLTMALMGKFKIFRIHVAPADQGVPFSGLAYNGMVSSTELFSYPTASSVASYAGGYGDIYSEARRRIIATEIQRGVSKFYMGVYYHAPVERLAATDGYMLPTFKMFVYESTDLFNWSVPYYVPLESGVSFPSLVAGGVSSDYEFMILTGISEQAIKVTRKGLTDIDISADIIRYSNKDNEHITLKMNNSVKS